VEQHLKVGQVLIFQPRHDRRLEEYWMQWRQTLEGCGCQGQSLLKKIQVSGQCRGNTRDEEKRGRRNPPRFLIR